MLFTVISKTKGAELADAKEKMSRDAESSSSDSDEESATARKKKSDKGDRPSEEVK